MSEIQTAAVETSKRTVMQGDYLVSSNPRQEFAAVLGSCVSACLYDADAKVGGMNHFLLPEASLKSARSVVHGVQAMELLLNALLKNGAKKQRIKGKLFGGCNVLKTETAIGSANATFAVEFLKTEGIPCVSKRLGGRNALQVRFFPVTGQAMVRQVRTDLVEPVVPTPSLIQPSVTLF